MKRIRTTALILLLLSTLIVVGTVGFHLVQGWGWFKSLYTTLMTVSTIGAGAENDLNGRGQIFNVILIFLGVAVVGFAIGSLMKAVIEFELGSFFGRRRHQDGRLDFNHKLSRTISTDDCLIVIGNSQSLRELESLAGVQE